MDKWFESDTVLKLVALGLAIMLWMTVNEKPFPFTRGEEVQTTIRNVTLEVLYDKERLELTEAPPTVNLRLSGAPSSINRITPDSYRVYIDLRDLGPGKHRGIPVRWSGFPSGVKVESDPKAVSVTLEEKQQIEMPVQVDLVGDLPSGFKAGEPVIKPTKVLVRGSESLLEEVTAVKGVVNVKGSTETVSRSVALQVYGENGPLHKVEVTPSVVEVEVPITAPDKSVPLKVDVAKYPPEGYAIASLTTDVDRVTVYGPEETLNGLEVYPGPSLDLSGVTKDRTFELPIPPVDERLKVEPKTVKISVTIVKAKTKKLEKVPIRVNGLGDGLKAEVVSPKSGKIDLVVVGAPKLLDNIKLQDIRAVVDASNLPPGEHIRPIRVNLPAYVQLKGNPKLEARIWIKR
ncbi:MAG: CdaR family protein [Planifilum fulgidum]|jgi:YbbR domain-containing protein